MKTCLHYHNLALPQYHHKHFVRTYTGFFQFWQQQKRISKKDKIPHKSVHWQRKSNVNLIIAKQLITKTNHNEKTNDFRSAFYRFHDDRKGTG